MILSDFDTKGKIPHASGGIAGQLHLNQGGRAKFQDGALAAYQTGQNIVGPYDVSAYEAKGYSPGDLEFLSRTQIPTEAPEWYIQEQAKQKEFWDPSWGEYEAEPWEDMQEQAKVHMMRELGPYHEMEFTNPNALMMPPVGPVPPGLMEPGMMPPIAPPTPAQLEAERLTAMQARGIDPRMARSYQENIRLMGDPRMIKPVEMGSGQAYAEKHNIPYAKGGRASYTKGGLAKILGV